MRKHIRSASGLVLLVCLIPFVLFTNVACGQGGTAYSGVLGDNIGYRTGELTIDHVDAVVPGIRGLDARIVRHYSSEFAYSADTVGTIDGLGVYDTSDAAYGISYLGAGWQIEPPHLLFDSIDCFTPEEFLVLQDGSRSDYFANLDTLTNERFPLRTRSNGLLTNIGPRNGVAADTLLLTDGTKWVFGYQHSTSKYLTSIISLDGDIMQLNYFTGTRWLKSVVAPSGLWIHFRYTICDSVSLLPFDSTPPEDSRVRLKRLEYQVFQTDSIVDTITIDYAYRKYLNKLWLLSGVTYPSGQQESYDYTHSIHYRYGADWDSDCATCVLADSVYDHTDSTWLSVLFLRSITTDRGAQATFRYRYVNIPVNPDCRPSPDPSCGSNPPSVACVNAFWNFRSYIGVDQRISDDGSIVRFRYETSRHIGGERIQTMLGTKSTVLLPSGERREAFFWAESGCEYGPGVLSSAGGYARMWPGGLYQSQVIVDGDTLATGYSYGLGTDTIDFQQIGTRYDHCTIAFQDSVVAVPIYAPSVMIAHPGAVYYTDDFEATKLDTCTSETHWISQYSRTNQMRNGLPLVSITKQREAQRLSTTGTTDQYKLFPWRSGVPTDSLAFTKDSLLSFLYVASRNLVLITKQQHIVKRDIGFRKYYTENVYDTTSPACVLLAQKVYFDTATFHITDTFITQYEYDDDWSMVRQISPFGDSVTYQYDDDFRRSATVDNALGVLERLAYLPDGKIKYRVGLNGDTTKFTYDHIGRDWTTTLPLENSYSTLLEYDVESITSHTRIDTNLVSSSTTLLDKNLRALKTVIDHGGGLTSFDSLVYDSRGLIEKALRRRYTTDSDSMSWSQYFFDQSGRTVKMLSADGLADSIFYDHDTVKTMTPRSIARQIKNFFGEIVQSIAYNISDTTTFGQRTVDYDSLGQVWRIRDFAGRYRYFSYDRFGRRVQITDPDVGIVRVWYNKRGQIRLVRRNSEAEYTFFRYDRLERLIAEGTITTADTTQLEDPTYPSSGMSSVSTYRYDSYSASAYWTDTASGLKYYAGRLTEVASLSGWTHYYYDLRGRVRIQTDSIVGLGAAKKFKFDYYANNALKQITYPENTYTTYAYNAAGAMRKVSSVVDSISYEPWGAVRSTDYNNGVKSRETYDLAGHLTKTLNWRPGQKLFCRGYTFTNGFITQELDLDSLGDMTGLDSVRTYQYDGVNRLIGATMEDPNGVAANRSVSYSYDVNCNLDSVKITGFDTLRYVRYPGNNRDSLIRFDEDSTWVYAWDGRGRLSSLSIYPYTTSSGPYWRHKIDYSYDYRNLLRKIVYNLSAYEYGQGPDSVVNWFNSAGQKIRQSRYYFEWINDSLVGGDGLEGLDGSVGTDSEEPPSGGHWVQRSSTRYYIWSGGVVVWESQSGSGTFQHVYGVGERLATRKVSSITDSVCTYVYDYLDNVHSYVKPNGVPNIVNLEYYPYGQVYSRNGNSATRFEFISKEVDFTAMADFGPRYYQSNFGRFACPDPILSSASAYAYTDGNPIMQSDPSGLKTCWRPPTPDEIDQAINSAETWLAQEAYEAEQRQEMDYYMSGMTNRHHVDVLATHPAPSGIDGGHTTHTAGHIYPDQVAAGGSVGSSGMYAYSGTYGYSSVCDGGSSEVVLHEKDPVDLHITIDAKDPDPDLNAVDTSEPSWATDVAGIAATLLDTRLARYNSTFFRDLHGKYHLQSSLVKGSSGFKQLNRLRIDAYQAANRGITGAGRLSKMVAGGAAILAPVLTAVDIYNKGYVSPSDALDLAMAGVAFIPGVGTAISITYFAVDTAIELSTGEDIGEHLIGDRF